MNKHHALANQGITKAKLFTCFIAVVLAFGLTAMPALAAPEGESSESTITIVAVDNTSEDAESGSSNAPAKEPVAAQDPAQQPAKDEASSTTDAKKDSSSTAQDASGSDAPEKEELNAAEKAAAVLQGETRLAVANSTGISAQSYDSYGDDTVDDIFDQINNMSSSYTYDIRLDKFMTGPLYTTKNEDGSAKPASYTVMFEIEGVESNAAGAPVVYAKRSVGVKVDHNGSGSLELVDLPRGYYTIKEIVGYPGCAYTCTTQNPVSFWIGYKDQQENQTTDSGVLAYDPKFNGDGNKDGIVATVTFKNKANEDQKIFSQGYVNEYSITDGAFGFKVKQ